MQRTRRTNYTAAARLRLLNQMFAKAAALIDAIDDPARFKDLAIAVGVLIDKRRLEDGQVTDRWELQQNGARERLASRLDELAARRQAAGSRS